MNNKKRLHHLENYLDEGADEPDHVYYNVNMANNTGVSKPAIDSITLAKSILENAKEYYVSVIRFVMDGSDIPILTVPDPTPYKISVVWNGNTVTRSVDVLSWMQDDRQLFSFTAFAEMVNVALTSIQSALNGLGFPTLPGPLPCPPLKMRWSSTNYTFPIIIPPPYAGSGAKLYMNTALYNLFGNYYADVISESSPLGLDVQIFLDDLDEANTGLAIPSGYWIVNQEYTSTSRFFDVTSILFLSSTLNQSSEYYPVENTSASLSTNSSTGAGNASLPILTDFQPIYAFGNPAGPRQYIYYSPTSQYKLTDMMANKVNQLDIRLMTRDRQGRQAQIYIPPYQSIQLKIAFIRKSIYNQSK